MAADAVSRARDGQLALAPSLAPPWSLELTHGVWGIDPQTTRVGVGMLSAGAPPSVSWAVQSLPRNPGNLAQWFALAARTLIPFFVGLRDEFGYPVLVLVEEPFGGGGKAGDKKPRTVHPSSNRMLGVILAALGQALGVQSDVDLIQPNSWKRAAMGAGRGGAKPAVYLEWAREVAGYSGELEDEAAGIGIATAAGVRVAARRAVSLGETST